MSTLLKEINAYTSKLEKASSWHGSEKSLAEVELQKAKKFGEDYIYEFYCYLRVLSDLQHKYLLRFIPGSGAFSYKFPKAPAPKKGKPYFVAVNQTSGKIAFQICAATEIGTSYKRSPAPDISFQRAEASETPTFRDVIMIFDAKFIRSTSDKDKIGLDQFYYVSGMVRDLQIVDPSTCGIEFRELAACLGNCILTNGDAHCQEHDYVKYHNLKTVEHFDVGKTFKVIG
jgi:hypothetical protein